MWIIYKLLQTKIRAQQDFKHLIQACFYFHFREPLENSAKHYKVATILLQFLTLSYRVVTKRHIYLRCMYSWNCIHVWHSFLLFCFQHVVNYKSVTWEPFSADWLWRQNLKTFWVQVWWWNGKQTWYVVIFYLCLNFFFWSKIFFGTTLSHKTSS